MYLFDNPALFFNIVQNAFDPPQKNLNNSTLEESLFVSLLSKFYGNVMSILCQNVFAKFAFLAL